MEGECARGLFWVNAYRDMLACKAIFSLLIYVTSPKKFPENGVLLATTNTKIFKKGTNVYISLHLIPFPLFNFNVDKLVFVLVF